MRAACALALPKLPLPAPPRRDPPRRRRPLVSARTMLTTNRFGQLIAHVEHQPLRGVTPAMLLGWYRRHAADLGGEVRLHPDGFTVVRRVLGIEVMRLEHRFGDAPGGASYRSWLVAGIGGGAWAQALNRRLRALLLPDPRALAWVARHVEEVGLLEALLPAMWMRRRVRGALA